MTVAGAAPAAIRSAAGAARSFLWRHPDGWLWALSALAWWAWMASPPAQDARLCIVLHRDLLAPARAAETLLRSGLWRAPAAEWACMVGAMMLPLAVMPARHVAFRSLWSRRHLALAEFAGGFALVWMATGPLAIIAMAVVSPFTDHRPLLTLALALAGAIAWELTPMKAAALRACHRRAALAPRGVAADLACVRFGVQQGQACVASCWVLMLCPMLTTHGPLLGLCVCLISLAERILPTLARRLTPIALAATGAALLAAAWAGAL